MQFVEVSAKYFISSKASLYWIAPQEVFPKEIPVLFERFAETHVDGRDGVTEQFFEGNHSGLGRN